MLPEPPTQPAPLADTEDLRRPDPPLNSRTPRFVRQTGKNCAFASAAMLLDKWTSGAQRPSQLRLRAASRVPATKGVGLAAVARSVGRVSKIELRYSPGGGDPLTWGQLLSRLERGGGAIVAGSYSRLPRHYQRWDRSFAAKGRLASGHAVYVERYEPGRGGGRLWMMDPLATALGYQGEWISARALRSFAWRNPKGLVTAAATPEPAPLAGYEFGMPELAGPVAAGGRAMVRLPVQVSGGWPEPEGVAVSEEWTLLEAAAGPFETTAAGFAGTTDAAADDLAPNEAGKRRSTDRASDPSTEELLENQARPSVSRLEYAAGMLEAGLSAPSVAGVYLLRLELRRGDGTEFVSPAVPTLPPLHVRVHGSLAGEVTLVDMPATLTQGSRATVTLSVTNLGSEDWRTDDLWLIGGWQTSRLDQSVDAVNIRLDAGEQRTVTLNVAVPSGVVAGRLLLGLVTHDGRALADYGYAPLNVATTFAPPSPGN
jgi:hypothetical protein